MVEPQREPEQTQDAQIIPIGTRGRPGRGSGRTASSAARSLAPNRPRPKPVPKQVSKPVRDEPEADLAEVTEAPSADVEIVDVVQAVEVSAETTAETTESAEPADPAPAKPARTNGRGLLDQITAPDWQAALSAAAREVFGEDWEPQLATFLAFVRRRLTGDYAVDQFGFDPELTRQFFVTLLRPIAHQWFRIEVRGVENIPLDGGALIVSNHSGTVPVDALMTMAMVHEHTGRFLRSLGADLVFRMPVVSSLARKGGSTLACNEDAERLLRQGELVGVWPEGFKGIGKPYSERYKLQRFGRGGFVSAAMRTQVPIVPVSVVGAEEIYPLVGNIPALAKLFGIPYLPITPFFPWLGPLGMIPLPSKWLIEFGEPIRTDAYEPGAADDPMLVFNVTDQVRETIQQTLYTLLMQREGVFK